jgi:hypothetical protein
MDDKDSITGKHWDFSLFCHFPTRPGSYPQYTTTTMMTMTTHKKNIVAAAVVTRIQ